MRRGVLFVVVFAGVGLTLLGISERMRSRPSLFAEPAQAAQASAPPPLAGRVTRCQDDTTGFLGLGSNHRANARVANDSDEAGLFTVHVHLLFPGNGRQEVARVAIPVPAHAEATGTVEYRPIDGARQIECELEAPLARH